MTRSGDSSYEIARASGTCAATGVPLQPGEPYIAALVEAGDGAGREHADPAAESGEPSGDGEGLQRLDYSLEAWERGERPRPPLRLFGFWKARFEPGETRRQPLIDDESLVDLFEQLEGAEDPARQSFRYILALLLIRKRLLKFEGTRRDEGASIMLLRRSAPAALQAGAPTYEVFDPGMDDAQIAQAMEQLGSVMAV
jgi:hypothetical protein